MARVFTRTEASAIYGAALGEVWTTLGDAYNETLFKQYLKEIKDPHAVRNMQQMAYFLPSRRSRTKAAGSSTTTSRPARRCRSSPRLALWVFASRWKASRPCGVSRSARSVRLFTVRRAWFTGEVLPAAIRQTLEERHHIATAQAYAVTEPGGAIAYECREKSGMHFMDEYIVEIVDPETGKVVILRYTAVQDAGKAIYPDYVESQIQGGVAQGIGWALNEEYLYDENGRLLNANWLDYRMAVGLDLPMIDTIIVEVPNPEHPYGVRGVGEVPIVPPPAALANAIYRAIGVRMDTLPMSPPRIVAELEKQKG